MKVVGGQGLAWLWPIASCSVAVGFGLAAAAAPQRLSPPTPPPLPPVPPQLPPVPPASKPAPEAASTLVVPIQADLDLVPTVEPDPQRGLAIRGLLRWRLPENR